MANTKPRRAPSRPFSDEEEQEIRNFAQHHDVPTLLGVLPRMQGDPRWQRLIQEAIERKRANG